MGYKPDFTSFDMPLFAEDSADIKQQDFSQNALAMY